VVRSLPAVRTVLDPATLGRRAARDYDLGPVGGCRFHQLGLNDAYELRAGPDRYALRLYRRGWTAQHPVAAG